MLGAPWQILAFPALWHSRILINDVGLWFPVTGNQQGSQPARREWPRNAWISVPAESSEVWESQWSPQGCHVALRWLEHGRSE